MNVKQVVKKIFTDSPGWISTQDVYKHFERKEKTAAGAAIVELFFEKFLDLNEKGEYRKKV